MKEKINFWVMLNIPDEEISIRELSKKTKIGIVKIYEHASILEREGLIKIYNNGIKKIKIIDRGIKVRSKLLEIKDYFRDDYS